MVPSCDGSNCSACNCNCSYHTDSENADLRSENERLKAINVDLRARLQKFKTNIENELKKKEAEMRANIEQDVITRLKAQIEAEVNDEMRANIEKEVRNELRKKLGF